MFSPIVQEKKGCLTTFEEKKQKEVVKCFGSQIILVVYIFVRIGLYKGLFEQGFSRNAPNLASRLPGVATADRMGNSLFVLSGEISFCKDVGIFHRVLWFSKRPSVRCQVLEERAREHLPSLLSPLWRVTTSPALRSRKECKRSFL